VAKSDARSHTLLDNAFVFEDDAEDLQLQEALAKAHRASRAAQDSRQAELKLSARRSQPSAKISTLQPEEQLVCLHTI